MKIQKPQSIKRQTTQAVNRPRIERNAHRPQRVPMSRIYKGPPTKKKKNPKGEDQSKKGRDSARG